MYTARFHARAIKDVFLEEELSGAGGERDGDGGAATGVCFVFGRRNVHQVSMSMGSGG